jgi:hypothetical protein
MKRNKYMNSKLISLMLFAVLLSTAVSGAKSPFSSIGTGFESLMSHEFTIPHPAGNFGDEKVTVLAFILTSILITMIFYGLVTWEKTKLTFLSQNNRVAWVFSIAIALLTIISAPVVEWMTVLLEWSFYTALFFAFLIIFTAIIMFGYAGAHKVSAAGTGYYAEAVKDLNEHLKTLRDAEAEKKEELKKHIKKARDAKIINENVDGLLKEAKDKADRMKPEDQKSAIQYLYFVNDAILNIPVFDLSAKEFFVPQIEAIYKDKGLGKELLRITADKLRELKRQLDEKQLEEEEIMAEICVKASQTANKIEDREKREKAQKKAKKLIEEAERTVRSIGVLSSIRHNTNGSLKEALKGLLDYACRQADLLWNGNNATPGNIKKLQEYIEEWTDRIIKYNLNKIKELAATLAEEIKEFTKEEIKEEKKEIKELKKEEKEEARTPLKFNREAFEKSREERRKKIKEKEEEIKKQRDEQRRREKITELEESAM